MIRYFEHKGFGTNMKESDAGEWVKYEDADRVISNIKEDLQVLVSKHAALSLRNHELEEGLEAMERCESND